jgi:hypothetical protein
MTNVSDLDAWIDESVRISRKHGYHPIVFEQMRERHGTRAAIEKLVLSAADPQSGFERLKNLGLLEWTVEQAVIDFPTEFPNPEIRQAAQWSIDQARGR